MDLIITILPVVTKDLPISPRFTPYIFLSRCKFSTLTTRQPMVEFYLLTFPRFPLRKKEHKSYFGKNRTHDFRTSRCAAYLLDHSGDERQKQVQHNGTCEKYSNQQTEHLQTVVFLLCVFFPFILSSLDVPAGVTQEEGHTGFLIHLLSAVRAFNFSREKDSAVPFPRRL